MLPTRLESPSVSVRIHSGTRAAISARVGSGERASSDALGRMVMLRMRALRAVGTLVLLGACSPGPGGGGGGGGGGGEPEPGPGGDPIATDGGGATPDATPGGGTMTGGEGEPCDGADSDADGTIDEGCGCTPGDARECYPGSSLTRGIGPCAPGLSSCVGDGEFGTWSGCEGATAPADEACDDGVDDDCDGTVDEGCSHIVNLTLDLDGDCITTSCPPEAPYPVACMIMMDGGDERGCVASTATGSVVYFQEGDACGAGHVGGTLSCSSDPGVGLNESNCMINKPVRYYPSDRSGCPDT